MRGVFWREYIIPSWQVYIWNIFIDQIIHKIFIRGKKK